jgi:hypothetical protein
MKQDERFFHPDSPLWCKVGLSRTNLYNRLKVYSSYWPTGIQILALATIEQPETMVSEAVMEVERYVLSKVHRIRERIESLYSDQTSNVIKALKSHPLVSRIWVHGESTITKNNNDTLKQQQSHST